MIGEAFVNLISLLNKKGILTDKEAMELLDSVITKAEQHKAALNMAAKQ